jgi:hypothetical protein
MTAVVAQKNSRREKSRRLSHGKKEVQPEKTVAHIDNMVIVDQNARDVKAFRTNCMDFSKKSLTKTWMSVNLDAHLVCALCGKRFQR